MPTPDSWVDPGGILVDVSTAIMLQGCRAVFIVGDTGLGASTLLAQVSSEISPDMSVMPIHGSPALSGVPYGVLAPYLSAVSVEDITSPVAVLRTIWAQIEQRSVHPGSVVLVIDDAHALDDASATLIAELVHAGWAKVVASSKPHPGIPAPLLQLWHDGAAERFDLTPLTRPQGHELCVALLGGEVLSSTSWHFWTESAGNPLLLKVLVREAQRSVILVERHGVWLITGPPPQRSMELVDVVRLQLSRMSAASREALNLVALAEPASRSLVEQLVSVYAVQELLDHRFIAASAELRPTLRLQNPVYGEVLRRMVPAARSLQLRQRFIDRMDVQTDNAEALLRMVTWSLDCGSPVPDQQLLRAAFLACKLFQNQLALRIASAIREPDLQMMARAVTARSHFNSGHYDRAAALLEPDFTAGSDLTQLLIGSLLWPATRAALGHPLERMAQDAELLRSAGRQLAQQTPKDAAGILAATQERASLIELMMFSLSGNYAAMEEVLPGVLERSAAAAASTHCNRSQAFALSVAAEQLCAIGKPASGAKLALDAIAHLHPRPDEVFFLPEFVLIRCLSAILSSGEWETAQRLVDRYASSPVLALASFGGGTHVALGFIAIRQGKMTDALRVLLPGLEALRISDPQQLFGLAAAMAFYAAASQGLLEEAQRLSTDYSEVHNVGMYLATVHAQGFFDAGEELLVRDGRGIARLLRSADSAAETGAKLLELHALQLCLSLGDTTRLDRFCEVAAAVEGPWAQALAAYGTALRQGTGQALFDAGTQLMEADAVQLASSAYAAALDLFGRAKDWDGAAAARGGLAACHSALGLVRQAAPAPVPKPVLTQREHAVIVLAAEGLTDRQIADQLHISVRTVEGHLYRCYSKLGIGGRDELDKVASL
ncbi:helix-turn-helix domain-containing protein [Paenarthrobacter sp. Z7-10]|uniref:LuxR C-terminal-related transcriptional regulator n=1 Tax=Paenarthrobacter sp. Z7-10 TaxID=2787635 RepID=UPI0022A9A92C|nr:LuxR family transcriptional regulator [Paenarthrobacter sp. Z7-10]MCZ2402962.1 helix-turn-helix domain-containing protein [Paenarthrobacter sp. Z7-10]